MEGISLKELLEEEETMNRFITSRTNCFNCNDMRVGGANAMKWFGNFISAHLYLLSIENKWIHYHDVSIKEKGKGAAILLLQPHLEEVPERGKEAFVKSKLSDLFTFLLPLVQEVAKASKLSLQQTWGLVANSYYNHLYQWLETSKDKEKIECDVKQLRTLDSTLFGLKRNPFDVSFRYVDSWWEPVELVRVKPACCMSYLKAEGHYCFSCPKLTNEERFERGEKLRAENT